MARPLLTPRKLQAIQRVIETVESPKEAKIALSKRLGLIVTSSNLSHIITRHNLFAPWRKSRLVTTLLLLKPLYRRDLSSVTAICTMRPGINLRN